MSLLATLTTDSKIADETDSVGSRVLDTDVYRATITSAYIGTADSGALSLVLQAKTETNDTIKSTLWMTSGKEKGCKNYYEKDGEKHYLPGFLHANSLALLTCGKEISQIETEQKVVKVYSSTAKAEVPTKVEMLMELLGKEVKIGLMKQKVDKTKKNAAGVYEATGETREENEIDKLFRASDDKTTAEIRAQAEEAVFINTWLDKFKGTVKNKSKGQAGTAGAPGAPASATKKAATSLFS